MTADFTIPVAATATNPLTAANVVAADNALLGIGNDFKNGVKGFDIQKFYKSSATLASDTLALAVANMTRYITVDTQGAAAADDLSSISGGSDGQMLYLVSANAARVVTIKHNVGNIKLSSGLDTTLSTDRTLMLFYNGTYWSDTALAPATQATVINTPRTVIGADVGSQIISSIPATYQHLLLILEIRTDAAATTDNILLRFNGDATVGNYYSQIQNTTAAAVAAAESLGALTGINIPGAVGNTGSAGNGRAVIWIPNYASTTMRKLIICQCFAHGGNTTGLLRLSFGGGDWTNTANAISSITFLPSVGTNIKAQSAYTLYGYN